MEKAWTKPKLTVLIRASAAECVLSACKRPIFYDGGVDQCMKCAVGSIYPVSWYDDPCGNCHPEYWGQTYPLCQDSRDPATCWNGSYYSWWCITRDLASS